MHIYSKVILPILVLHAAARLLCAAPDPMGTAFNYQGYLTDKNGKPIDGQYDLKFDLYDVPKNGSPLVSITNAPTHVNKGLFTTSIDFGGIFNGNAYWLQIGVRPNGSQNNYDVQSPRVQIRPVPYSLFASNAVNAATANIANGVSGNAIDTLSLQDNSVIAGKIASGQVVKSFNGLFDHVTLAAGANVSLTTNGNGLTIASTGGGGSGWSLTGNAGTTPSANFLGTTDNQPLEIKVFNTRALRLEWGELNNAGSVNAIGGSRVNRVLNGSIGVTIAGGGEEGTLISYQYPNEVRSSFGSIGGGSGNIIRSGWYATIAGGGQNLTGHDQGGTGDYSTVGGGKGNVAQGDYSTIPGGHLNWTLGAHSFAAGKQANAIHDGSFVWGDGTQNAFSKGPNRFDVLATGGAGFFTGSANPAATLHVQDNGGAVGLFVGDLSPFGNAAFESNLSSPRTHLYLAENGVPMFSVAGGGGGYFAGSVSVCSLTIRGGCDLAEPFQMSDEEIPKGSVVVIDDENPGRLKRSTQAYDTRVAGIVSGANGVKTGVALKQEGTLDQGENVALSGRVYVKADASFGAIKPGDLLTTSATAGHAMKASDPARAQGAILGKAMSALSEKTGMVLVLVTLQ